MPVKVITTEFGHSMPPEGPHTLTTHAPGWNTVVRFRDGDKSLMPLLKSMYPRFTPWGPCRELVMKLHKHLSLPDTHFAFPFLTPDMFAFAREYAYSDHRKEKRLSPGDLAFKAVDVGSGTDTGRIYLVVFPLAAADGVSLVWGNPGVGVTTRLAQSLLPAIDAGIVVEVPVDVGSSEEEFSLAKVPPPTYLPEGEAHGKLRERIVGLLKRASIAPEKAGLVKEEDVYLYQTGMASIFRLHQCLMKWREGKAVVLGSVFHNTWHLLEEAPAGFKHFGRVDGAGKGLDELEDWLGAEAEEGRKVSYVFVEFPSNPILVSPDLKRIRGLADKYDFVLVVDDTIGSFSNVDLSPVADVLMSSTTKSFSGYADVMGGSLVLFPSSPQYQSLKTIWGKEFHNECFAGDAAKLLSNNEDYLARSTVLNRNAEMLTAYLQKLVVDEPAYGISKVLYPTVSDTLDNYKAFMRKPTADFTPGYGCLFSIEFADKDDAVTFYDNLNVFQGPHLGAHHTLAICFNEMTLGKDPEAAKYHIAYGVTLSQVRISVGLESEEELLDTFKAALEKIREKKEKKE